MSTQADQDFAAWKQFHGPQLAAIKLPESLHRKLWHKLAFEDFDLASSVKMILDEAEDQMNLMAIKPLQKDADVFLIDHAWSFRY